MERLDPDYAILNDPEPPAAAPVTLDLAARTPVEVAAEILDELYRDDPRLDLVRVRVGGMLAAVTSRQRIDALLPGTERGVGTGDGATLPGESTRYRLIRLRCPVCAAEVLRLHVDPQAPPTCPAGHGGLERVP
jgi:hypothetical protein